MLHEEETPPSGVHVAATGFRALIAQSCAFGASSCQCNQAGGRSASTKPHRTRGAAGFRSPFVLGRKRKRGRWENAVITPAFLSEGQSQARMNCDLLRLVRNASRIIFA
jgi:hypothetical protein